MEDNLWWKTIFGGRQPFVKTFNTFSSDHTVWILAWYWYDIYNRYCANTDTDTKYTMSEYTWYHIGIGRILIPIPVYVWFLVLILLNSISINITTNHYPGIDISINLQTAFGIGIRGTLISEVFFYWLNTKWSYFHKVLIITITKKPMIVFCVFPDRAPVMFLVFNLAVLTHHCGVGKESTILFCTGHCQTRGVDRLTSWNVCFFYKKKKVQSNVAKFLPLLH